MEGEEADGLLGRRPDGADHLEPGGEAGQVAAQEPGYRIPIVGPMQLRLAQAVQQHQGRGGGQAAGSLQGGQRPEDALQQGRLGVGHAVDQRQARPVDNQAVDLADENHLELLRQNLQYFRKKRYSNSTYVLINN